MQFLSGLNKKKNTTHEERIFSLLFNEDELTWQTLIYDLVKTEAMDPWDVNISLIADKFIQMLNTIKQMDFRIGGKMVLAAALLLKIKSERLMKEDIVALDNLINAQEPEDFLDELEETASFIDQRQPQNAKLVPRTPQPRQRKVSVYDLVDALEKALTTETKKHWKKSASDSAPTVKAPEKKKDVTLLMAEIYKSIRKTFSSSKVLTFDQLLPSQSREDKVYTFMPLLHLDGQRKIDLLQEEHFGTIHIKLNKYTLESAL